MEFVYIFRLICSERLVPAALTQSLPTSMATRGPGFLDDKSSGDLFDATTTFGCTRLR